MCFGNKEIEQFPDPKTNLFQSLTAYYERKILPLETHIDYESFGGPPINAAELTSQVS